MVTKYVNFQVDDVLNENVQQAKTFMKNRAFRLKKESEPEVEGKPVSLNPMEVKKAENDPDFLKIKNMLTENPGYTYLFTKFFFEDLSELEPEQRYADLKSLYNTLKDMRQSIAQLPMPVDRYASQAANEEEEKKSKEENRNYRKPHERLMDDLSKLKGNRVTTKFVNQLLVWQKAWFEKSTPVQKEKIDGIAAAFDEFGKEPDGSKDAKKNKELQDYFFLKVKKYKTVGELIDGAISYIKSSNNAGMSKFLQAIAKVNMKYGEFNGVEEVYNENNVLIIEIKSFVANRDLNANTSHCIAGSQGSWDHYVGDNKFSKQYYIYNFNLAPSDNKSVIGITIGERASIEACHLKNDGAFSGEITTYMKKLGIPMSVLAPMTPLEIEKKKKRMIANKEIVKDKLSTEQVKQYYEEGGDVNAQQGKPLQNAVKEDNYEKTKYLLDVGAMPNVGNAIKYANNLKMIKLLVDYRSQINNEVFNSIMGDYEAVEYVLKAGIDPNFEKGYPIRTAVGDTKMINLLITYGANIAERRYMVVKWAASYGKMEVFKFLLDKMRQMDDPNIKNPELKEKFLNACVYWCETSDKINDAQKKEVVKLINGLLVK